MREIKFRGKRADNGKWVYGGYHKHQTITPCPIGGNSDVGEIVHLIIEDGFSDWNLPKPINAVPVFADTIGQYTGLKDKNGVEIYELDEVKAIHRNYENEEYPISSIYKVTWLNGCFMFGNWNAHEFFNKHTHIEVIDNVHDKAVK